MKSLIALIPAAVLLAGMVGVLLWLGTDPAREDMRNFCGAPGYFSKC
jgi:hypothetical protein